ncbi:MAG TPA: phosphoribosyltransferase family protein [Acidimicrobiia bacterium]|jgi:predicted phosphoribosyltransferase|nr:phosphoribosyltransferase family protein [Acidimicrobiia bacterium]
MASGSGPVVPFPNRRAGGAALAALLSARRELDPDPVVVALPRGGVPVGVEVADALGAPLDVIIVRKLGTPGQPELAMGAIGEGGARILNHEVLDALRITDGELEAVAAREQRELDRRAQRLRAGRARVPLTGHTAILVDDGLATGSTARAAILVARAQGARRVVVATPVAPRSTVVELGEVADAVVCVATPEPFRAIGQWYVDFRPTSDDQVVALLDR